jgi:hypothetical protein
VRYIRSVENFTGPQIGSLIKRLLMQRVQKLVDGLVSTGSFFQL